VNDILREPAVAAKKFDKERDFDGWPLPENVGLTLDRDDGLLVASVVSNNAAEKAGLKVGDVLGAAGGRRCFSQTDFRGALHRGPHGAGEIEVWWKRGTEVMSGKLAVADGWRKTILDWRMSVSQGIVGAYPGFFPLAINSSRRAQFNIASDKMAVEPYMGTVTNSPGYAAGLRGSQIVTAVNGESPNLAGRAFLVWFIKKFDPGDRVTVTVMDKPDQGRDLMYQLPPRGK
jgi:S1-C subfamily serine protease